MPEFLVQKGDGSLTPYEEKPAPEVPEKPQEKPKPAPAQATAVVSTETAAPSAGKPADQPVGGSAPHPSGGSKPTISQQIVSSTQLQPGQRGPETKTEESGSAAVAKSLAPQLGTAPEFLTRQQIDERKMAVLNDLTQTSLNYLAFRGYVDKVRFWAWFVDSELVTSQAIGGLARRHVLRAIEASSGAQITEVAKKPGILARNVWERTWKKDAIRKGKELPAEEYVE